MKKREFEKLLTEAILSDAEIQGAALAAEPIAEPIRRTSRERFYGMLRRMPEYREAEPEEEARRQPGAHERFNRILTYVLTACAGAAVTAVLLLVVIRPFRVKASAPIGPAEATVEPSEEQPTPQPDALFRATAKPGDEDPASDAAGDTDTPELSNPADAAPEETDASDGDTDTPPIAEAPEAAELVGTWVAEGGDRVRDGYLASLIFRTDGSATWSEGLGHERSGSTELQRYTLSGGVIRFWTDGGEYTFRETDAQGRILTWNVRYNAKDSTIRMICSLNDIYILKRLGDPAAQKPTDSHGVTSIGGGEGYGRPPQDDADPSDFFGH